MGNTKTAGTNQNAPSLIGLLIRTHRLHTNMSLRELSAAAGMNHASLSQIERGYYTPHISTITAIAQALRLGKMARASLIEAVNGSAA
jgi:transcriptional regulator with XRE-family HTH domain|tara:strand:- start:574 stop:837 length:264 start_codon:yes stop_codon:yes gene_type:complete